MIGREKLVRLRSYELKARLATIIWRACILTAYFRRIALRWGEVLRLIHVQLNNSSAVMRAFYTLDWTPIGVKKYLHGARGLFTADREISQSFASKLTGSSVR